MKTSLKASLSTKKTLLILSVICVVLGAVSCILGGFGEFILPIVIANLAAIYLYDKKRTCALIVSGILIAFNVAGVLLGLNVSFFSLAAIVTAVIIAAAYSKGQSKSDAAFLSTVIYALLTVCGMMLLGMMVSKEFSFDAAVSYWTGIYDELRGVFVKGLDDVLVLFQSVYDESEMAYLSEVLHEMVNISFALIIYYLVIGAFTVVGFSMKAFGFIVKRCAEDNTEIKNWRFATSSVYAYFYLALSLASIFVMSVDNIFGVAVLNLYYIFNAVYIYVGFKAAIELLRKKLHPALCYLIVIAALLLMSGLASQILSVIGVIYTFSNNRKLASHGE